MFRLAAGNTLVSAATRPLPSTPFFARAAGPSPIVGSTASWPLPRARRPGASPATEWVPSRPMVNAASRPGKGTSSPFESSRPPPPPPPPPPGGQPQEPEPIPSPDDAKWRYIDPAEDAGLRENRETADDIDTPTRHWFGSDPHDYYMGQQWTDMHMKYGWSRKKTFRRFAPTYFRRWTLEDENARRAESFWNTGTWAQDRMPLLNFLSRSGKYLKRRNRRARTKFRKIFAFLCIIWLLFLLSDFSENMVMDDNYANHPILVDRLKYFGLHAREMKIDGFNGQYRAISDQLYGDESHFEMIKAPLMQFFTQMGEMPLENGARLKDFYAPEPFPRWHLDPHPLNYRAGSDQWLDFLQDSYQPTDRGRPGEKPSTWTKRLEDPEQWEIFVGSLIERAEVVMGDHLTLVALATMFEFRANLLTTDPTVPHHKAWIVVDPLWDVMPRREIFLLIHWGQDGVLAWDSLAPEETGESPRVAIDHRMEERRVNLDRKPLEDHDEFLAAQAPKLEEANRLRDRAKFHESLARLRSELQLAQQRSLQAKSPLTGSGGPASIPPPPAPPAATAAQTQL